MIKYKKYLLLLAMFPFQIITNSCGGSSNFSLSASLKGPKLFYSDGEKITKDEFNVVATYSDKTTKEINEWKSDTFGDSDTYLFTTTDKEAGYKTFNFEYDGKLASCDVTVKDSGVVLNTIDAQLTDPSKIYVIDSTINKNEIKVTGHLSDGTTLAIDEKYWTSEFFGDQSSQILKTLGQKEIDIAYLTFKTSITIDVKDPTTPTYTIIFDTLGGSKIESQAVKFGGKVIRPANPTKESDTFDDWYTEKELTNKYNFDLSVSTNLTLYAGWKHKVTFTCEVETEETFDPQYILDGRCANNPGLPTPKTDPSKICYGWELNDEPFDFSTPITKSVELKAKFTGTTQNDLNIEILGSDSKSTRELNIDGDYLYQVNTTIGTGKNPVDPKEVDFRSLSGFVDIYDKDDKKELKIYKECSGGTDSIIAHTKIDGVNHYGILQIEVASFDKIICYENKIKTRTGAQEETTGRVVIPSKHYTNEKGWRNITEIGDEGIPAFKDFNKITSVDILSNKITQIHKNTFQGCSSLTSISMPSTIVEIADYAFESSGLKKINLHENIINIGAYAFANNKNLDSISLPKSIETIGKSCFENCSKLDYAYIPETLTTVNYGAFKGCPNLAEVKIDSQVMLDATNDRKPFIVNNATTIIVRKDLKVGKYSDLQDLIDDGVVKRTTNDAIESQEGYVYYERSSGSPFLQVHDWGDGYRIFRNKQKRCVAPEITYVPTYFENKGMIKKIVAVEMAGFHDITLSYEAMCRIVHLPSSIAKFYTSSISGGGRLTKINIPRSLKVLPEDSCCFNLFLNNLYFDSNSQLETFETFSFICNEKLETITLPDSVTTINEKAFYMNQRLHKMNIPKNVTQIRFDNFYGCAINELIFDDPYDWTIDGKEVVDVTDPVKNASLARSAKSEDRRNFVKKPINKLHTSL